MQQRADHLERSLRNRIRFLTGRNADDDIAYRTKRPELWLEDVLKLLLNIKIKPLKNNVYSNRFDVQQIDTPPTRLAFKPPL
jgi:hypothetical protein